ncbi:hypothetical protein HPB50_000136 [Hyalomma asiaticum]|uniref:Uncharacterized protein n=1 Tax=Hyalomma asiaticum TaxID=266040 RepID=A0ACB7RXH1_HYAAI|nr:hypothetical protein HPB50_000136 [Hyalomma asiaticum]
MEIAKRKRRVIRAQATGIINEADEHQLSDVNAAIEPHIIDDDAGAEFDHVVEYDDKITSCLGSMKSFGKMRTRADGGEPPGSGLRPPDDGVTVRTLADGGEPPGSGLRLPDEGVTGTRAGGGELWNKETLRLNAMRVGCTFLGLREHYTNSFCNRPAESTHRLFWELDGVEVSDAPENFPNVHIMEESTKGIKTVDGRYEVRLPWRDVALGDNRSLSEETWPIEQKFGNFTPDELEQKREIEIYSSATKMGRVTAWVFRNAGNLRTKAKKSGPLTAEEMEPEIGSRESHASSLRALWKKRKQMLYAFWQAWRHEYLLQLRLAYASKQVKAAGPKIGEVVLVQENVPSRAGREGRRIPRREEERESPEGLPPWCVKRGRRQKKRRSQDAHQDTPQRDLWPNRRRNAALKNQRPSRRRPHTIRPTAHAHCRSRAPRAYAQLLGTSN